MIADLVGSMDVEGNWEMRLVIAKETKNDKRPVLNRASGQRTRSCSCGQQLDVCARAHCPRCGRNLHRG
jgi:uncharacterized paraquat-inducible protein A